MNISYNWLKRYINLPDTAEDVAKVLTSVGLEVGTVEKIQTIKGGLEGLVVGEVLTCVEHPNSDHLHITTVDFGGAIDANPLYEGIARPVQIVCGAPNVAAGQKVIVATLGTTLYDGDESFMIKKSKIRGIESFGMLCAEDEIGVGQAHDGIMILPADTPVGMLAKDYFHVESDTLIEVDITPNRSDGASHFGVARDLYAYYQAHGHTEVTLTRPNIDAFQVQSHALPISVRVENESACPRYCAVTIRGVEVKESPSWLKTALRTIGLRPINNIVDVTNFVLHEQGQAMHAFDADKIQGQQVIVKNVAQGTKFLTLDEVERELNEADLMICNAQEPMCIAGVFGGFKSGVTEETKNVFLESAYFDPVSIRKTARRHGLNTDASFRYERGCDPNNTLYNLKRCALLIQEVAGGEIGMDVVDTHPAQFDAFSVDLSIDYCNRLIGKELDKSTIEHILKSLEIEIAAKKGDAWSLLVPRYRVDVQRPCDVVEDILRIYGFNNIGLSESLHSNLSYSNKPDSVSLQKKISEQLTAQGFNEILNNSLTKVSYYQENEWIDSCVKIMNPLSADLGVLRQTLLFGGLESIARNVNRKNANLKFYEFGNCYHYKMNPVAREHNPQNPLVEYSEEPHLGVWLTGNKAQQSWVHPDEKTSFYQLRAYVNNVLTRLGVDISKLKLESAIDMNQDMSCGIAGCFSDGLVLKTQNNVVLGYLSIVSPKLLKKMDIDGQVFYADLYWNALLKQNKQYKLVIEDLPKFPEVKRDLALLVDKTVQFSDLARAAFEVERRLLRNVYLFDVYEGKNLESGKKSYALSFVIQDKENTLKDKQIESIMARLQKVFEEKFNAKLRS